MAASEGELANFALHWRAEASCAVVMAARGYPGEPALGGAISGLDRAASVPGALVFQAGTRERDGALVADGGRVLTFVGMGSDAAAAREAAYRAAGAVEWPDGFYRGDIGLG